MTLKIAGAFVLIVVGATGWGCGSPGMPGRMSGPLDAAGPVTVTRQDESALMCSGRGCTLHCGAAGCGYLIMLIGASPAKPGGEKK